MKALVLCLGAIALVACGESQESVLDSWIGTHGSRFIAENGGYYKPGTNRYGGRTIYHHDEWATAPCGPVGCVGRKFCDEYLYTDANDIVRGWHYDGSCD